MSAKILDGNKIASEIKSELKEQISKLERPPSLAVVLCSDDPASKIYVQKKQQACAEVGINSFLLNLFEGGIEKWLNPMSHLLNTIDDLNNNESVDGILVQLPLPKSLDPQRVFDRISPLKDVDVFSPLNVGLLLQGRPRFIPCTPAGIHELLTRSGIQIVGKKVAIINRSDIVGKPLHALLIQNNEQANATCTLCHDHTPPELLKEICLSSDIIVVAVGIPDFLKGDMVPEGAAVVDVGINRLEGSNKIVGDVDFERVQEKASWISKVPGGVGPLTVAMLLKNTLLAKKLNFSRGSLT
jgi:methylenetetrahydrofolate dehydrogenase (NADP+)/methenyltetrahydrofolate cyclohydrolase